MIRSSKMTATRRRAEARVISLVRGQTVARDGFCRAALKRVGACAGVSEWAHYGPYQRFQTRKQDPERRHQTQGSLQLCTTHHQLYDRHLLAIDALTDRECDGPLAFTLNGIRYEEAVA